MNEPLEERVMNCLLDHLCTIDGVNETIELLFDFGFSVEDIIKCNFIEEDVLYVKNYMEEEGRI